MEFKKEDLNKIDEDKLFANLCREDFYFFVEEFWDVIIAEDPVWNWHIPYLCNELQKIAKRVIKGLPKRYDLIINIPPGTTKSTICSVMFPAWLWTVMPSARIIGASHVGNLANDMSRKSRMILKSEKYKRYFGIEIAKDCDGKEQIANTERGERYAVGVGGAVIGKHAHFILVDDPLDPKATGKEAAAAIPEAKHWFDEVIPTRKVDKAVTPMIVIMQRLHQDDPTGHLLEKAKQFDKPIRHICLPATTENEVLPPCLKRRYINGLLDPLRLSKEILEDMAKEMTSYAMAGQFGQTPVPRGGGEFDPEQITVHDAPTSLIKESVRYWDKAGTQGAGCYTVGFKLGRDINGRFWILDIVRGRWRSDIRNKITKNTAKIDGRKVRIGIEQEGGSGGKESAENSVKELAGYIVLKDRPTGDKETRAEPFAIQVNNGNVSMVRGNWNTDLISEMRYWPNSKYKDQIDAGSGAFSMLTRKKKMGPIA
jgi:predicted phage terminase large subunit-like protein